MKDINIIDLDLKEMTLSKTKYNIGYTQYSSLLYHQYLLDGYISFGGSLMEFNNRIILDKRIPATLLKDIMVFLNHEKIMYTLHSEAIDFSNYKTRNTKVMTLPLSDFKFDCFDIYAISLKVTKTDYEEIKKAISDRFTLRILNEKDNILDIYIHLWHHGIQRNIDVLKHQIE